MTRWDWRRWTGVLGLVYVAIQVAALVLFFVAGNPPDFGDAKKYAGWINSNGALFMGDAGSFLRGRPGNGCGLDRRLLR